MLNPPLTKLNTSVGIIPVNHWGSTYEMKLDPEKTHLSLPFINRQEIITQVAEQATWKQGTIYISKNNSPSRTRSLFIDIPELSDRKIKLKGAGGFQEDLFNGVFVEQPDTSRQVMVREVKTFLDERVNLTATIAEEDYERCLEYSNARKEQLVADELFQHDLSFSAIIASAYVDKDNQPILTLSGDQLGIVALDYPKNFKTLGSVFSFQNYGMIEDKYHISIITPEGVSCPTVKEFIVRHNFIEKLKAKVRMKAIIETGLTTHTPHSGNFLADSRNLEDRTKEPHMVLKISDLDECSTIKISDFSPRQRAANLINEVAFGIFRSTRDIFKHVLNKENKFQFEREILPAHLANVVDGYLEDYISKEKRTEIAGELCTLLSDTLYAYKDNLIQISQLKNDVNYLSELYLADFRVKCISEIYDVVLRSQRFKELGIAPDIHEKSVLHKRLKTQYKTHLKSAFEYTKTSFTPSHSLVKEIPWKF